MNDLIKKARVYNEVEDVENGSVDFTAGASHDERPPDVQSLNEYEENGDSGHGLNSQLSSSALPPHVGKDPEIDIEAEVKPETLIPKHIWSKYSKEQKQRQQVYHGIYLLLSLYYHFRCYFNY